MFLNICIQQLILMGLATACSKQGVISSIDLRNATISPGYRVDFLEVYVPSQTGDFAAMRFDSAGNLLAATRTKNQNAVSYIQPDQEGCYGDPLGLNLNFTHNYYGYIVDSMDITANDTVFVTNIVQDKDGFPYTDVWMQAWNATSHDLVASEATIVMTGLEYDDPQRNVLLANTTHLVVARDGLPGQGFTDNLDDPNVPNGKIKAFDLEGIPTDGYDFSVDGQALARGVALPNAMARAKSGGFWVVNNAIGYVQSSTNKWVMSSGGLLFIDSNTTSLDYGYPHCYVAWNSTAPNVTQGMITSDNKTDLSECNGTARPYLLLDPDYYVNDMIINANFTEMWFSTGKDCSSAASVSMIRLNSAGMPIVPNPKDPSSAVNRIATVHGLPYFANFYPCLGLSSLAIDRAGDVVVSTDMGLYKISRTTAERSDASRAFLQSSNLSLLGPALLAVCFFF